MRSDEVIEEELDKAREELRKEALESGRKAKNSKQREKKATIDSSFAGNNTVNETSYSHNTCLLSRNRQQPNPISC